jgi:hypothetical protein
VPCVNAEDLTSRSGSNSSAAVPETKSQKDSDVSSAEVDDDDDIADDDDDDDEDGVEQAKPEKKRSKTAKS